MNKKINISAKLFIVSIITLFGFFAGLLAFVHTVSAQYAVTTCNSATLNGNVVTNGATTNAWFEWGQGNSVTYSTPVQTFSSDSNYSQAITGLSENTLYSFRAMASNKNGNSTGQTITFTTSSCTSTPTTPTTPATPIPTVTLSANPSSIAYGGSSSLTWNSTNATSCNASGGNNFSGGVNTSGSISTGNLFGTTTYNITCTNSAGSANAVATVTVQPQQQQTCQDPSSINYGGALPCRYQQQTPFPTVTLTANPSSVISGNSSNLTWNSTNATSCFASGGAGFNGTVNTSGYVNTGSLTNSANYNITCSNGTGSASAFATVTVQPEQIQTCQDPSATNYGGALPCHYPTQTCQDSTALNYDGALPCRYQQQTPLPTVTLSASPSSIAYGSSSNLSWSSSNATSCTANGGNNFNGNVNTSGSINTGILYSTTNYNITCTNSAGSAIASASVFVSGQQIQTCQDSSATNYGSALPCVYQNYYQQTCQDPSALNYRGLIPCQYQQVIQICQDPSAINYRGTLPCTYPIPVQIQICQDPSAINYRGTIPCQYPENQPLTINLPNITTTSVVHRNVVTTATAANSLVLINSSINKSQAIIPTLDNSNPHPGDIINYTVDYQNVGNASITNLTLQVTIPGGVDYLSANPSNPTIFGNTLIFNLGTLKGNAQGAVTVQMRVEDTTPVGTVLNFPAVLSYVNASGQPQSVTANVSATVTSPTTPGIGANVFGSGFLPNTLFGWLILLILLLLLLWLAKYAYNQVPRAPRYPAYTPYPPYPQYPPGTYKETHTETHTTH